MSITLRISITKEVLEATKDCIKDELINNCAISYAVRDIWPTSITQATHIYLHEARTVIFHKQELFILRFDHSTPAERAAMQPFSFDIEVPDEVINDVNIDGIREILKTSKTLQIV